MTIAAVRPNTVPKSALTTQGSFFPQAFNVPPRVKEVMPTLDEPLEPLNVPVIRITEKMIRAGSDPTGEFLRSLALAVKEAQSTGVMRLELDPALLRRVIHIKARAKKLMDEFLRNPKSQWNSLKDTIEGDDQVRGTFASKSEHNLYCPKFGPKAVSVDHTNNPIFGYIPPELLRVAKDQLNFSTDIARFLCKYLDQLGIYSEKLYESLELAHPERNSGIHSLFIEHSQIPVEELLPGDTPKTTIIANSLHRHPFARLAILLPSDGGSGAVYDYVLHKFWLIGNL